MRRATFLMIVLAIACIVLGVFTELPVLIGVSIGLGFKAWKMADADDLLRLFA
ncbi:hypothetical protein ACFP9V_19280 [Deinococcus radiopugnans]|uniref:Uncharacterized protein n=1 Tax=Deinococcus radiopugnans ATCC 19172 TaxID=585398 RepID=A0ABR6NRX7_9DEIO|nr:hypothetical protein [Deinococcus radiopugnans]MBB6016771.1 hypothetical protein [Deinococcus radiopugnans ATCC 19172]